MDAGDAVTSGVCGTAFCEILCNYAPFCLLSAGYICQWNYSVPGGTECSVFTDLTSPQAVGTVIGISATGKDEGDPKKVRGKLRYQLSVSDDGTTFHVVRDFTRFPGFAWSPKLYEHESQNKSHGPEYRDQTDR